MYGYHSTSLEAEAIQQQREADEFEAMLKELGLVQAEVQEGPSDVELRAIEAELKEMGY